MIPLLWLVQVFVKKKSIVLPPEFFVVIQKIESMYYAMSFLLGHTGDGINGIAGSTDDYDFICGNFYIPTVY
jgi:hypothetical protein